jgi:YfiH family protein
VLNKLELELLKRKDDFIIIEDERFQVVFTNAEKDRSFNRSTEKGVEELEALKEEFNVDNIVYLKQIHSDKILVYKSKDKSIKDEEGDAIITNEKNVIIGVFTADCVPIILIDEENNAAAAIHSGWKGTFESITFKTIEKMQKEFGTSGKNLKAYIGPHIRKCCYEVSEELKLSFIEKKVSIGEDELFKERNLNLEACIVDDLKKAGILDRNINSLNLCTYCSDEIKLHSYRKSQGAYGRMFGFIILR